MNDTSQCAITSDAIEPDFYAFCDSRDRDVRNRLIERHLGIAHHLARRYRYRGVAEEDLVQVATIGLLKAIERFDPQRGTAFVAFATPTILGELRRYFRDSTWALRVPRQLQERVLAVGAAVGPLAQRLARSPTPQEIAHETGLTQEEVLEALEAGGAYGTTPLESAADSGYRTDKTGTLADAPEQRPDQLVEQRLLASALVAHLSDREQYIVDLRFARNMTQSQIAERIGVSQMHVSRLLSGALAKMREFAGDESASV